MKRRLTRSFYRRDSRELAPLLLNKVLVHNGRSVRLVEVEAYAGDEDPGSHAFRGVTPRNAVMFGPPGHLYVYRSYGIHWCANVVCGDDGWASAVLLRGGTPLTGLDEMYELRPGIRRDRDLTAGPGRLCQALGINATFDGSDIVSGSDGIELYDDGTPPPDDPGVSGRIGLSPGKGDAAPWRYYVRGALGVSRSPSR
ncbi:MAG: DNA-3-methyladenine glycosylase [Acidimicrobiia bacterium]|nr:DNA-3-methyladenine glycosylase [Acidimicrobiia bacterium]